ncbi:MAG TPA: NTP transferase domain-containing protein [Methylomirabilota bacterium]|nr:NTP transferase domain-containing protein [Methylomirabilota bacterium]
MVLDCDECDGLAGVVLAGGEGRRFGGPKAWAKLPDGRTFLEACVATLAGARPIVATLPPGSEDPGIAGLEALALPRPGLDMFASLRLGLERVLHDEDWRRVAVLPVDHPLVRPATVAALAAAEGRAVIPSFRGKHGHPVVVDRETALGIVSGELPGPTLREVLAAAGPSTLPVGDPGVTANCNTPDALAAAWTACLVTRRGRC